MQANQTKSLSNYNNSVNSYPYTSGSTNSGKALGSGQAGGDYVSGCVTWLEQNATLLQQVHQAMMNGNTQGLGMSDADIQTLLGYEQYANSVAYGSSWGGGMGAAGQAQAPVPGNMWYDSEEATITATGDGTTHNSSSYINTVNVSSTAAEVSYDITTDTRTTPAVEVLRVTIKNKQTGMEDVVYFDNFRDPDFSLTINTPKGKHVSGNSDGVPVTVGEFDSASAGGTNSGVSGITGGEVTKIDDTHSKIVSGSGETIDVESPNRKVDETQYFDCFGPLNLSLDSDLTFDVSTDAQGNMVVTVFNAPGMEPEKLAVYNVPEGFAVQVNHANWKHAGTINGKPPVVTEDEDGNKTVDGPADLNLDGDAQGNGTGDINYGLIENVGNLGLGTTSYAACPPELQALADALNWPHNEMDGLLLNIAISPAFGDDLASYKGDDNKLSMSEMKKAIADGVFPPAGGPNGDITAFFCATDKTLQGLLADLDAATDAASKAHCMDAVSNRMVTLLSAMFPGHDIHQQTSGSGDIKQANNLVFDGQIFECFSETDLSNTFSWHGAE